MINDYKILANSGMSAMKISSKLTALTCAVSLMLSGATSVYAVTDTSYRQIQDYAIFNGSGNINWCDGQNLEVVNSKIPY